MQWPEILLIDKPAGITSFDVIRRLRKQYTEATGEKAPKLGHAGTLDPAATGLMILGVGKGTKRLTEFIKLDKEYVADIVIGRSTTTGDVEGETLKESDASAVTKEQVAEVLQKMVGTLRLSVSAYSAIKKDGIPMYKRAREAAKLGDLVTDIPIRDMKVFENELLALNFSTVNSTKMMLLTIRWHVGSGTYIRSLGEELGRQLGHPASLAALRRTKIAEYVVEDARTLEK